MPVTLLETLSYARLGWNKHNPNRLGGAKCSVAKDPDGVITLYTAVVA